MARDFFDREILPGDWVVFTIRSRFGDLTLSRVAEIRPPEYGGAARYTKIVVPYPAYHARSRRRTFRNKAFEGPRRMLVVDSVPRELDAIMDRCVEGNGSDEDATLLYAVMQNGLRAYYEVRGDNL